MTVLSLIQVIAKDYLTIPILYSCPSHGNDCGTSQNTRLGASQAAASWPERSEMKQWGNYTNLAVTQEITDSDLSDTETLVDRVTYVPGDINPADLPTRGAHLEELDQGSVWQNGPDFLSKNRNTWPLTRDFLGKEKNLIPDKERRKKIPRSQCPQSLQRLCHHQPQRQQATIRRQPFQGHK